MSASKQSVPVKQDKIPHVEIYWTAVTYRTVMVYASLILAVLLVTVYIIHPDWYGGLAERMARTLGGTPTTSSTVAQNQPRFVNLDGKVEVKKVNSVSWNTADYHTTLDKGDLIRTDSDGAARITFVDGTTYTVKRGSLRHRGRKLHRTRSHHQRGRAHQLRHRGPCHAHVGIAAIEG